MTVEEMKDLMQLLDTRIENYRVKIEIQKEKLLENPTDKNIERSLCLIHSWESEIDNIHHIRLQLKFDIEDITGEEVDESVWSY